MSTRSTLIQTDFMCTRHVFFTNETATTEIYTLSLHDALPIDATDLHRHTIGQLITDTGTFATQFMTRRSEEHTSELQSRQYLVCRLLLEKKKTDPTKYKTRDHTIST